MSQLEDTIGAVVDAIEATRSSRRRCDGGRLGTHLVEDGLVFSSIRAPFVYRDEKVRLTKAVAKSASIGVSVSGVYAVETGAMNFEGVFTPLYALNSALGGIPLLGKLLTGGDGQGLFAFNFAVRGDADDPKISVNPFSVLTPGALRGVFGGQSGGDPDEDVAREFARDDTENSRR